ncbi:MAG: phage tail tape measure protein [Planctomycetota bacterium]
MRRISHSSRLTKGIRAGRAFVELFADDSKLVRGLRRAEKKLKAFGASIRNMGLKMASLGAAMLAPMAAAAKVFSSMGDEVAKMSKRTGVSVETLSELRFVASQTGTEFATLENAFRKMQRSIYDAGRGLSTAVDALADLGLTFKDLDGLSPEQQFKLLADRISQVEDPTRKAAIAMSLFGRTGTNLLPMFAQGAKGIEALQKEARRLGLTMSAEDAAAAEEFTDTLDKLWKVVKMGVFRVGAALAPVLDKLAKTITDVVIKASAWIQKNHELIVTVMKIAAAVLAGGIALAVLGTIISALGSGLGVLVTIVTTVGTVFKLLGSVIGFMLTPIGAVIAAVAALGIYLLYTTEAGGKALTWLGGKFNILKEDALAAFGGISDALAAGDMGLAMKVLWLTLKMEWTRGVNFLEKAWLNFRNFFIKIGYDAWDGLLATVEVVWHALEVGWIETVAFLSKAWTTFVSYFARAWQRMKGYAKKAWTWIKGLFDDSTAESRSKVYAKIDQETSTAINKIDNQEDRDKAKAEAERQRKREEAAELHDATMTQIGKQNLDKHKALDDEYAGRMSENEADLIKARKEWQDAINEARDKRKAKEDAGPGRLDSADDIIAKANNAIAGLDDLLGTQAAKIGAMGTFVASNVLGLQAGGAADRMATGIDKIEKNTRPLKNAKGVTFT